MCQTELSQKEQEIYRLELELKKTSERIAKLKKCEEEAEIYKKKIEIVKKEDEIMIEEIKREDENRMEELQNIIS